MHEAQAGLALLAAAQATRLVVLLADQVREELATNEAGVEQAAADGWRKFQEQAQRIHDFAVAYGVQGNLQIQHIAGHAANARLAFDHWKGTAITVPGNPGVVARAFRRVMEPRTPARQGKESMKDCVVLEAYLGAAGQLRAAGLNAPIVFASSNTRDYRLPNSTQIPVDLTRDLAAVRMEYAASFGLAKHLLGL